MKKEKNKKFHFRLPKLTPLNLILMILIPVVIFFVIAIPVLYVNAYNANKVNVFSSQLEDLSADDKKKIVYGNKNTIDDFEFILYCTNYDNESGTIKFQAFAYENEKTRDVINLSKQISVRLGMYSDWIKCEKTSSSYNKYIATGPRNAMEQSRSRFDFTINSIPKLPQKGSLPFIKIKTIPVYAYITYTTTINGTETTKRYILKYEYNDYVISSKELEDKRQKELTVKDSYIQWKYKNDTSWTKSSITTDDLVGVEARVSDTHIQWKRKCDTDWIDYSTYNQLTGAVDGKKPNVKIENGAIRYQFEGSDWKYLVSTSTLTQINVQVKDGYIQWKRPTETEWNNLKKLTDLKDYNSEKDVEVQVSGSNVQWRHKGGSWATIVTVDSLCGVTVKFDDNRNLQWKCVDENEWKNVIIDDILQTEGNLDTKEIKYGPTAGGI